MRTTDPEGIKLEIPYSLIYMLDTYMCLLFDNYLAYIYELCKSFTM